MKFPTYIIVWWYDMMIYDLALLKITWNKSVKREDANMEYSREGENHSSLYMLGNSNVNLTRKHFLLQRWLSVEDIRGWRERKNLCSDSFRDIFQKGKSFSICAWWGSSKREYYFDLPQNYFVTIFNISLLKRWWASGSNKNKFKKYLKAT